MHKYDIQIKKNQATLDNLDAHVSDLSNGGNTKIDGKWQQNINRSFVR
jgi:hypothetical protein